MSRPALEALQRQRVAQAADKLRAGGLYEDGDWVFANELGACISPMAATDAYARIAQKAQISSTRLHDTRHTAATTLLLGGVDVARWRELGYSVATTTLSIYAHLMADTQRDAIDRLGEAFDAIAEQKATGFERRCASPRASRRAELLTARMTSECSGARPRKVIAFIGSAF